MGIISCVAAALQFVLGPLAEEVNQKYPAVRRVRKFSPATLARTFVLGMLAKPRASVKELAETAAFCGVAVSPQAIEQRFTPQFADYLQQLVSRAVQEVIQAATAVAPLLERFTGVKVLDSTVVVLANELAESFPGCGGSHGSGQAAVKIQLQWDLRSGGWSNVSFEPARVCDYKTPLQTAPLPEGTLTIADQGYFDTAVFQQRSEEGVYWLSRLQYGTAVYQENAEPLNHDEQRTRQKRSAEPLSLMDWLARQPPGVVDQWVQMGAALRVACRLLAWRVPEEVANRRRQKLIAETQRKRGRTPTRERLAWCDWTILVTNVPFVLMTPNEALVLYRARWQIELLFKRWKSLGALAELTGKTVAEQMVRLWSRMLAIVIQHWLVLCTAWGDCRISLTKAFQLIQNHANNLYTAIGNIDQLISTLERLKIAICSTALQNKRKRPSTFELLNNPDLIEELLT